MQKAKNVMYMWNINCYVSSSGKNDVQETYDFGTDELKAQLEVGLEYLRIRDRQEWRRPRAAKLTKCEYFRDFFEIRLFADNLQQRPIGYFGPNTNDFTILIWATEKGGNLIPLEWCKKANRRRNEINEGIGNVQKLLL